MEKISKRKKITIFISIIIVIVTILLIIGANIIKINISNNKYNSANNGAANNNLLPEYIKEGVTLGGVTGTLRNIDTSDATATECDIINGKTAYVNGVKITGIRMESTLGTVTGTEITNTEVNDEYGNKIIVPAGFKIANPDDNITKGIIIEDVSAGNSYTKGSQFVWIPIDNVYTTPCREYETITFGRYNFEIDPNGELEQLAENYRDETEITTISTGDTYKELLNTSTSNNTKAKDLKDFIEKVSKSGGFYIGRYEAGDAYATNAVRTENASDTNPIVCKAGIYPYNYVTQPQAANLSRNMYNSNNFESDLINSYAWDTAIIFIQKFSNDTDYSQQKKLQNTIAKCGESTDGTNNDVRCNIYDMAGNTYEWNTETGADRESDCTDRGGCYSGTRSYTGCRWYNNSTSYSVEDFSFRTILYL